MMVTEVYFLLLLVLYTSLPVKFIPKDLSGSALFTHF